MKYEFNENKEQQEPFTITELKPFTNDDIHQEPKYFCVDCTHRAGCPIIDFVNQLSMKRDGVLADKTFSCSILKVES